MSLADRFLAYADAFEQSYETDDWSLIEPYFTEDAVYVGEPESTDRNAILTRFKNDVDRFDKRMDSRTVEFETPAEKDDTVTVGWQGTYTLAGCPDLVISGTEIATFEGDRISRLEDVLEPDGERTMNEWMQTYGERLA
jgi:hypothetical protein